MQEQSEVKTCECGELIVLIDNVWRRVGREMKTPYCRANGTGLHHPVPEVAAAECRRLEPKPGAEAKPVCTCGHDYAEHNFAVPGFEGRGVCCSLKDSCLDYEPGPSAQPKPDAAGEAREYRCSKCGEELEDGFCPCENSITPLLDGNEKLCGSYENRLIDTIQQLKARSAPRNSALEEAAKDLGKALAWALPLAKIAMSACQQERVKHGHTDIQGTYKNGETWAGIWQNEVDDIEFAAAALVRFRALGGE